MTLGDYKSKINKVENRNIFLFRIRFMRSIINQLLTKLDFTYAD